jgi:hypothetical protein
MKLKKLLRPSLCLVVLMSFHPTGEAMAFNDFFAKFLAGLKPSNSVPSGFGEEDRTAGRSVSGLEGPSTAVPPATPRYLPPPIPNNDLRAPLPNPIYAPTYSTVTKTVDGPWWTNASMTPTGDLPMNPEMPKKGDFWHLAKEASNIQGSPTEARDFLDPVLDRFALLESRANPLANKNNKRAAKGMYQFVPSTAKAYGLKGNDVYDPVKSRAAARALMTDNHKSISRMIKRPPKPHEIYLGHQQGAAGAAALINRPTMKAVDALVQGAKLKRSKALAHITDNGGHPDMTSAEFTEMMGHYFYDGVEAKNKYKQSFDTLRQLEDE